jgi:hypothetical protein
MLPAGGVGDLSRQNDGRRTVRLVRQYHTSWSLASPRAMAGIGKGSSLPSVDSAETNGTGSALETEGRRGGLLAMLERKARRNEKKQR